MISIIINDNKEVDIDEVTKTAKKFDDSNYVKVGVLTH